MARESAAAMAPDRGVLDSEPLAQPERLREVARGHLDVVAAGAQVRDHGSHHEHVRGVRQVDPDPHPALGRDVNPNSGAIARSATAPLPCPPCCSCYASVTDSLVNLATHIIRDLGLAGVALLTLTSGVIGMPGTEPTMLFAGFNVFQGHLSLFGIIVFGVLGDMIGASIAYAIGYFGPPRAGRAPRQQAAHPHQRARARPSLVRALRRPGDRRLAAASRSCARCSRTRPAWPGCRTCAS